MAAFVNQASNISALGPKFDKTLSVSAFVGGVNDGVDEKSIQAQQLISSLKQRTVVIGHEIEETTTYLLPPATAISEEEEVKTISELATLTRSAQQMTSSKLQTLMNKLGMKTVEDNTSTSPSSASASASKTNLRTTPRRALRRQQTQQHQHQNQYHQTTMSPRSHHKTPSTSSSINHRNNHHYGGGGAAAGGGGKGGDLFSNLHLSSSPSSLLSNLLLDGPLESVIEADYETDTTTPASSTVSPSTATSTPASSSWSAYKTTKKNSTGSSGYNKWKNSHCSSNNQRHFQSPRDFNSNSGMKSFQSPSPSSRWSTTKKQHQNQETSSTSPLTPPPMNSLSFSNSTSTFLQHNSTTIGQDDDENNTLKEQHNDGLDAGKPHVKKKTNKDIFSPYSSSPLSSSSSFHDATATSNRPKTPGAAALLRPSPPLTNDGISQNNYNNNNNTDENGNRNNFLPLHRALNFEFREEDDMITLDTQSTLATVPQAPPTSTTNQAQSQSQSQRRRRASSTSTSTSTTGGDGFEGRETAGVGQYTATSSATKEDSNDFLARMEGMLERVEESMVDDNTTNNSSLFNGVGDNLDEPSRPSDEMNASMFRRHHHHNQYRKALIGMDNDDSNDSSSNDDSTNIAPTVVQDTVYNSSRVQRQAKSSATPVRQYKERPTTQIVVDQSLPSPAHTNITMDNTMITAEFGGLEDFELPAMKNNGVVQKKNRISNFSKRESSTNPSPGLSSRDDGSENDPDLDCLSVLTPVLDRYRVEPGGDSNSDIKVIPNQRRPHPTHEAYRKKKMTVKHRVDVGTGNTPYGGVDGTADDDVEYQGITPIMSNVPTVSAFQSPPPSSKIKSTPVSSVTSRKKKVYPKTPIPGKFGSKSTTGGENTHPNMSHRNDEDKKHLSFLSPVGNQRTDTSGGEFVVPRLRPSTLDKSAKRTKGRRVSNSQLSSAGRRPSNAAAGWPTTPSSSLARAQRNWETRDFSSFSMTNDEPYHSAVSSSSSLADHESGRTNPVGVRLSKSPM